MTVSDLLDGAWGVITCRPRTVFGLTAMILVPAEVIASFLVRGYGQALDLQTLVVVFFPFFRSTPSGRPGGFSLAAIGAVAVLSLAYFLLGIAISTLVSGWYAGRDLPMGEVVRSTARTLPAVLGAYAILLVPKALSIWILALPALFLFPFVLLVAPVMAIERLGPWASIRRSVLLVKRRYARVLGIWILSLFMERVIDYLLTAVPDFAANFTPEVVAQFLRPAGWAFALLITAPAVAGFATLVYVDLRVRSEGLDLEVEATDVFATR